MDAPGEFKRLSKRYGRWRLRICFVNIAAILNREFENHIVRYPRCISECLRRARKEKGNDHDSPVSAQISNRLCIGPPSPVSHGEGNTPRGRVRHNTLSHLGERIKQTERAMDARFFVRHWWKFFPKKDAKVIESRAIIQVMKIVNKKASSAANTTGRNGEAQ